MSCQNVPLTVPHTNPGQLPSTAGGCLLPALIFSICSILLTRLVSLSFSTLQHQLVFHQPLHFLCSGFHPMETEQSLFTCFLRTCPIQHHLFLLISWLIGSAPAIFSTSLFDTCCYHLLRKILWRRLVWKITMSIR